jgi:hypothetical protein
MVTKRNGRHSGTLESLRAFQAAHGDLIEELFNLVDSGSELDTKGVVFLNISKPLLGAIFEIAKADQGVTSRDLKLMAKVCEVLAPEGYSHLSFPEEDVLMAIAAAGIEPENRYGMLDALRAFDTTSGTCLSTVLADCYSSFIARDVFTELHFDSQASQVIVSRLLEEIAGAVRTSENTTRGFNDGNCAQCTQSHQVLGVERDAGEDEVKAAYRDLAKVWHPDRFGWDERLGRMAEIKMKEINQAYGHLTSHHESPELIELAESGSVSRGRAHSSYAPGPLKFTEEFEEEEDYKPHTELLDSVEQSPFSMAAAGSDARLWRFTKVVLRTIWRFTKIILGISLAVFVAAIIVLNVFMALWRHWEMEAGRGDTHSGPSHVNDRLFSLLESLTWLPRQIWGGLMLLITPLVFLLVFAGEFVAEFVTSNSLACAFASCLVGLGILAWVFRREWKAEFTVSSAEHQTSEASWVMGLLVVLAGAGVLMWLHSATAPIVDNSANTQFSQSTEPQPPKHSAGSGTDLPPSDQESPALAENAQSPSQFEDASGAFDPLRALDVLYGPVDSGTGKANWHQPPPPPQQFAGFAMDHLSVRIVSTLSTAEGGVQKKYLITAAYPGDRDYSCHGCSAIIGVADFRQRNSSWYLEAFNPFASQGPDWNSDPQAELIRIGPDRFAVRLGAGGMGQGIEIEYVQIVASIGSWIGEVIKQDTSDSYGACDPNSLRMPCYSNRTRIQFVPGQNPEFFDIRTSTTGTKLNDQCTNTISANETQLFTLIGHSYQVTGVAASEPTNPSSQHRPQGSDSKADPNLTPVHKDGDDASGVHRSPNPLLAKMCDGGLAAPCTMLADFYIHGAGAIRDLDRGRRLLERACSLGHQLGCDKLRDMR